MTLITQYFVKLFQPFLSYDVASESEERHALKLIHYLWFTDFGNAMK